MTLTVKKLLERFIKNNCRKKSKSVEKVIKRKDDKLYVKWKGFDKSFNNWIDNEDIII